MVYFLTKEPQVKLTNGLSLVQIRKKEWDRMDADPGEKRIEQNEQKQSGQIILQIIGCS